MNQRLEILKKEGLVESAAQAIETWLTDPIYASFVPELTALVEAGDVETLNDSFYRVIPFGTGGRRGRMGIGTNRINSYTIAASAQGYSNYLIEQFGDEAKTRGIVVTYDVRHHSLEYARVAASVFAANGLKVYFFDGARSTPQISFTVRFVHAVGGAMISASHNPPTDNGIKIYWQSGGQVLPPHDAGIIEAVSRVQKIETGDFDVLVARGDVVIMNDSADRAYHEAVATRSLGNYRDATIVFTPMHGVATSSFLPVLQHVGFIHIVPLESQMNPDGDFSNVTDHSPNPEFPQALTQAIEKAKEVNADIVLASDPDADRIGVVSRKSAGENEFIFLNGNQIGSLLLAYIAEESNIAGGVVVKTIVTTDLVSAIATKNGAEVISDLPVGFKYIGDAIDRRMNGKRFTFGLEESHGYLYGDYARDKDGAIAALLISEYASKLKTQGRTLYEQLEYLSREYGYYRELQQFLVYRGMDGMEKMLRIMDVLRADAPREIGGLSVVSLVDQLKRDEFPDNTLAFYLNEEKTIRIVVRPSGTEPKIKFYAAVGMPTGAEKSEEEYQTIKREADTLAHQILEWIVTKAETISSGGTRSQVLG